MITFSNIVDRFEKFVESHFFLKTFSFGSPEDFDLDKFEQFPLLHLVYTTSSYADKVKSYSFEVYILDCPRGEENRKEFEKDVVTQSEMCAEDILADLENGGNIFDFDWAYILESASISPLEEEGSNVLSGCVLNIAIGVPYLYDSCNAPLSGVSPQGGEGTAYTTRGLLRMKEADGTPDVTTVKTIVVSNGTLTDDGNGVVTLDTTGLGAGTGGTIAKWSGSGASETLDDSIITEDGGNIGIDATNPNASLTLGDGTESKTIRVYYDDGEYVDINGYGIVMSRGDSYLRPLTSETQNLHIGGSSNIWYTIANRFTNLFLIYSGTDEKLRIDATGKVGIGTTPSAFLHVNAGDFNNVAKFDSDDVTANIQVTDDSGSAFFGHSDETLFLGKAGSPSANGICIKANKVGIGQIIAEAKLHVNSTGTDTVAIFESTDALANILLKDVDDQAYLECRDNQFRITRWVGDSGSINLDLVTGYVGLGTTSPTEQLHVNGKAYVNGTIDTTGNIEITGNTVGFIINEADSGNQRWQMFSASGIFAVRDLTGSTYPFRIEPTAPTNSLYIHDDGNIGIGTASPNYLLDVEGADPQIRINNTTDDGSTIIKIRTPGTTGNGQIQFGDTADSNSGLILYEHTDDSMRFHTNDSEAVRIDSSGNVGIGTSSPNYPLDVESDEASIRVNNQTENGDSDLVLQSQGTTGRSRIIFGDTADANIGGLIYRHDGNSLSFHVNDTDKMRILSDGKVGIGTNSPYNKFQVVGNARVDGQLMVGDSSASNTPNATLHIKASGTDARLRIEDLDNDNTAFDILVNEGSGLTINETTDVTSRLHIQETTGNVGIGTASPAVALDVNGGVRIGEDLGGELITNGDFSTIVSRIENGDFLDYTEGGQFGIAIADWKQNENTTGEVTYTKTAEGIKFIIDTAPVNNWDVRLYSGVGDVPLAMTDGKSYRVRYSVKGYNTSGSFHAHMAWLNGTNINITTPSGINDTTWTDVDEYIVASNTDGGGNLGQYLQFWSADADVGDWMEVKDVSVEELGEDWTSADGNVDTYDENGVTITSITGAWNNRLFQSDVTEDGKSYKVTYTIEATSYTAGTALRYYDGANYVTLSEQGAGTHTFYLTREGINDNWYFNLDAATSGSTTDTVTISSISVEEVDAPSSSIEGTMRYSKDANNSYVDMCMQTGSSTYAWVNIKTNTW